jgi:hypothetical protein
MDNEATLEDVMNDALRGVLESDVATASKRLRDFPKGPMGLVPDEIKASAEWREAKSAYNTAFAKLRAFNSGVMR